MIRRWRRRLGNGPADPAQPDDAWRAEFFALVSTFMAHESGRGLSGLTSTVELSRNAEEGMAVDNLCHVIESFSLPVTRAQYATLAALAARVGEADSLDEMNIRALLVD